MNHRVGDVLKSSDRLGLWVAAVGRVAWQDRTAQLQMLIQRLLADVMNLVVRVHRAGSWNVHHVGKAPHGKTVVPLLAPILGTVHSKVLLGLRFPLLPLRAARHGMMADGTRMREPKSNRRRSACWSVGKTEGWGDGKMERCTRGLPTESLVSDQFAC